MKPKRKAADDLQIRARAEAQLARQPPAAAASRPDADLLHELQVHQVELEMQNETLRQAQHELEDSRDRYLDLYDFAPVGYLTLRADGLIEAANLTAATLLGIDRKHLLLRRFTALVGADDRSRWVGLFMKVMQRDGKGALEVALQRGDEAVFQARLDCVADAGGTALRVALTDVTERELTLQHLQQLLAERGPLLASQQAADYKMHMLLQALEQTGESIVISNLAADIEYVNEAYLIHSGYRREELIGRNARMLQSGKTPKETYAALWSALSSGRTWRGELYNRTKDGREYIEYATISPLRLADGRITHYVGAKADITERKAGEVQLRVAKEAAEAANLAAEHANSVKSQFLATMSHEIRTPMNGVIGMAQLLLDSRLEPQQREFARDIVLSGESLLGIINDILDLSKIEAGRMEFDPHPFSVAALTDAVTSMLKLRVKDSGIGFSVDIAAEAAGYFVGDSVRIRQILLNLAGNAVKFTRRGEVRIKVSRLPAGLRFEVIDTGIGIPAEACQRIFSSFSQADASTTRRFGGTGLGLAISKQLAEGMGGGIGVDSVDGEGSCFWFELPLAVADPALVAESSEVAAPAPAAPGGGPPLRLLLVEDHPVNQKLALALLQRLGYLADLAENGREAVAAAAREPYALILMDMQMPEMDGLEAARRIRSEAGPNQRVPIVALTANAMQSDQEACRAAGMDDFLAKPFSREGLAACLARWIQTRDRP